MKTWSSLLTLLAGLMLAAVTSDCGATEPPSVLLVTIDTLRADHLSGYGYHRPTSPEIDTLASTGVTFDTAMAPLPETGPSCASLLTGRWPAQLNVRGNGKPLGTQFTTLAESLSQAGYETAAFVSGYPLIQRLSGLQRGFSHYDDHLPDPRGDVPQVQRLAEKTTNAVLAWLDNHSTRPFFVWLHYYDPHGAYAPDQPYDTQFDEGPRGPFLPLAAIPAYQRLGEITDAATFVARYDGEIRQVDTQLGRVLHHLTAGNILDRTVVVITADHGESLTEHEYYFDHGNELYTPSVQIPLIFTGPGVPGDGRRIGGVARTPDIMPTILDLLDLPVPGGLAGISLRGSWEGTEPFPVLEAFSEARFEPYRSLTPMADVGPKLAAHDDRFSILLRLDGPHLEVYDRHTDPGETRNLLVPGSQDPLQLELQERLERNLRLRLSAVTAGEPGPPPVIGQTERPLLERLSAAREQP